MAETVRAQLRRAANRLLHPLGLHLIRRERAFEMDEALGRARARGLEIRTVIDVGASDGIWSLRAQRHFPKARFLLFEPLAERHAALERLRASHGFDFVPAAAGPQPGRVRFAVDPALDGSGVATPDSPMTRAVPVETIDATVAARALTGPYCLKLDTHGFEVPVLTGAARVLGQTQLLVIEAYNFPLTPDCLRFHELCTWLEARGFRCCDLADPMRRPRDGLLWQMDLLFVPAASPWFASNRYV
jgi:FkbM family methyltransferase